ncbi:MAG: TrkH family potassium uptake protein [Desulfotomaculaceae bacterium]|nr:TrkH family potassium uptake protein [Desulfotomaculaceae bacterium]
MKNKLLYWRIKKSPVKVSPAQIIVLGYIVFTVLGALLLSLPISLNPGVELSFIDALFTATSAISVTGLTVVSTVETFSIAGRGFLLFLLQFGGIGIMTLGTLIYVLRGNQINLRERMMIRVDQNQTSLGGMVNLMLFIFKVAVVFELLGTLILTIHFINNLGMSFLDALGMAFFHSVSGFTNTGLALFDNSLQNFSQDYVVQNVMFVLLIAGAIGFPVLLELYSNIKARRSLNRLKFSLYTKVTTITFGLLLVAGFIVVLVAEFDGPLAGMPWHQKIWVALFQSLTTRSGGFSTVDISVFQQSTLLFFCLLMFIGASPSSCGGGIRTTTLAVLVFSMFAIIRGKTSVKVYRRELFQEDIMRANTVFFISICLVIGSVILLSILENATLMEILFETCSAFGTTGLSLGITAGLSTAGKVVMIFLMFVGRIGIVALMLVFHKRNPEDRYHYIKEHLIIG